MKAHELIVIHTSTPSFKSDCKSARLVRALNPTAKIGFIGAKVAVEPNESMAACPELDFVARNEYDFTIKEIAEGADWSTIKGLTYRDASRARSSRTPSAKSWSTWTSCRRCCPTTSSWT